jgi:hypothetical protein
VSDRRSISLISTRFRAVDRHSPRAAGLEGFTGPRDRSPYSRYRGRPASPGARAQPPYAAAIFADPAALQLTDRKPPPGCMLPAPPVAPGLPHLPMSGRRVLISLCANLRIANELAGN